MIYYISAAFILTLPNGLLADWDPSSLWYTIQILY
jgi:hypothetical protein